MNKVKHYIILVIAALSGLLSSCDVMGGLYDDPIDSGIDGGGEEWEYHTVVDGVRSGQYYIDATSYTKWIYVNLRSDQPNISTTEIDLENYGETEMPDEWDFALHHYDVKTNGAEVMMTPYHSIEALLSEGMPNGGEWVADEYSDEAIIVDMSHMLEGYLIYAPGYVNREASKWFDVDIGTPPNYIMPPIYTMRDNVMLYRFPDGTCAAIQLVNYMGHDRYQTKGWMTVKYKYPVFER